MPAENACYISRSDICTGISQSQSPEQIARGAFRWELKVEADEYDTQK